MVLVRQDPVPNRRARPGKPGFWLDALNEVRQAQEPGTWFKLSDDTAVQKVYDLRRSNGKEFEIEFEYLDDPAAANGLSSSRCRIFARLKPE